MTIRKRYKPNLYCCNVCGNIHLQMQAWVDINTYKYIDSPHEPLYYCDKCNSHVNPTKLTQYKLDKRLKKNG